MGQIVQAIKRNGVFPQNPNTIRVNVINWRSKVIYESWLFFLLWTFHLFSTFNSIFIFLIFSLHIFWLQAQPSSVLKQNYGQYNEKQQGTSQFLIIYVRIKTCILSSWKICQQFQYNVTKIDKHKSRYGFQSRYLNTLFSLKNIYMITYFYPVLSDA